MKKHKSRNGEPSKFWKMNGRRGGGGGAKCTLILIRLRLKNLSLLIYFEIGADNIFAAALVIASRMGLKPCFPCRLPICTEYFLKNKLDLINFSEMQNCFPNGANTRLRSLLFPSHPFLCSLISLLSRFFVHSLLLARPNRFRSSLQTSNRPGRFNSIYTFSRIRNTVAKLK